jgi:hypothetical protein
LTAPTTFQTTTTTTTGTGGSVANNQVFEEQLQQDLIHRCAGGMSNALPLVTQTILKELPLSSFHDQASLEMRIKILQRANVFLDDLPLAIMEFLKNPHSRKFAKSRAKKKVTKPKCEEETEGKTSTPAKRKNTTGRKRRNTTNESGDATTTKKSKKNPYTPFFLFQQHMMKEAKKQGKVADRPRIAEQWGELSEEEKQYWKNLAKEKNAQKQKEDKNQSDEDESEETTTQTKAKPTKAKNVKKEKKETKKDKNVQLPSEPLDTSISKGALPPPKNKPAKLPMIATPMPPQPSSTPLSDVSSQVSNTPPSAVTSQATPSSVDMTPSPANSASSVDVWGFEYQTNM